MATDPSPSSQGPLQPSGRTQRHAPPAKWIFAIVGGLFVAGLSLQFILAGMLHSLRNAPPPTDRWHPLPRAVANTPPFPRLQISPAQDLSQFREREESELNSYGWINRTAGVVRIPIERAMELVLRQGLPVRNRTNAGTLGPSSYELIQRRPMEEPREAPGGK